MRSGRPFARANLTKSSLMHGDHGVAHQEACSRPASTGARATRAGKTLDDGVAKARTRLSELASPMDWFVLETLNQPSR